MKGNIVTFLFALISSTIWAQEKLVDSWIYADVTLSSDSVSQTRKSLVDTGCSVCVIDSTYAANEFGIGAERYVVKFKGKKNTIVLDSVRFCGETHHDVLCMVANIERDFAEYAPRFIVGGNILYTGAWKFNLDSKTVEPYDASRKATGTVLHWKMMKKILNIIMFKGKVNGQRIPFMFDIGARYCKLPDGFDAGPRVTVKKEKASLGHHLKWVDAEVSRDVRFKIGKHELVHDFYHDHEDDYGLLNITAFGGHSFILNYKNRTLEICNDNQ